NGLFSPERATTSEVSFGCHVLLRNYWHEKCVRPNYYLTPHADDPVVHAHPQVCPQRCALVHGVSQCPILPVRPCHCVPRSAGWPLFWPWPSCRKRAGLGFLTRPTRSGTSSPTARLIRPAGASTPSPSGEATTGP